MSTSQQKLKIESQEGELILVDPKISNMVILLQNMLEDHKNYEEKIPLETISASTIKLIISFCEQCGYKNENFVKKPILTSMLDGVFANAWEKEFFDKLTND